MIPTPKLGAMVPLKLFSTGITKEELKKGLLSIIRLYLIFGGNRKLSFGDNERIESIGCKIEDITENLVRRSLPKDKYLSIYVNIEPEYNAAEIEIHPDYNYQIDLKRLSEIKRRSKAAYELVKTAVSTVLHTSYIEYIDTENMTEMMEPFISELPEETKLEKKEKRIFARQIERSVEKTREILKTRKNNIKEIKEKYSRLRKKVAYKELCETAIRIIENAKRIDIKKIFFDEDREDRPPLAYAFSVYWEDETHLMNEYREYLNNYVGESGPPCETIIVNSLKEIKRAKHYINHQILFCKFINEYNKLFLREKDV